MGSEPSYTVPRGSDLLWILDFFVLRNSGREVLKLVSPLRGILRTSKPSGAWRRPKGWQCLQPSPASAQTTHWGWGRDAATPLNHECPAV